MKSNCKTKRSTAGRPSSSKHVQPLMSIVTAYEQRGWPSPWRKPPTHGMNVNSNNFPSQSLPPQPLKPSPAPPTNADLPPILNTHGNQQQFLNPQSTPLNSSHANPSADPTTTQHPLQPSPLSPADMFVPPSSAALDNQQQFLIPQSSPSFTGYFNPPTTSFPSQFVTSSYTDSNNNQSTAPNTFTLDFLGQLVHQMVNTALLNNQPPTIV